MQDFLDSQSGGRVDALSQELFLALGMSRSTLIGVSATGSVARDHWGRSRSRKARRSPRPLAAMSMVSDAEGYARFLAAHAAGSIASRNTLAVVRERQLTIEQDNSPKDS